MSQETCRLCLNHVDLGDIFVNKDQSERYTLVLALTTGLKIQPNDGLPQKICKECIDLVNRSMKLRNQSHKTEIKLLKLGFKRQNSLNNDDIVDTIDNNLEQDNISDNLSTDCFDFDGFKIEVELDRLTSQYGDSSSIQDGGEKSEQAVFEGCKQPVQKTSRKEKRLLYMSLIEGDFNPNGPIKCKICKVSVSKWGCFINHAKKHLGFKFICEYCGKSFISSNQLKRHCRSFHGMQRDLKCQHCDCYALDKPQLIVHERRMHTGDRPYVCDECGNAYFSRKCLIQHTESHRTIATVQCDKCPLVFKSRRHLAKHRYGAHTEKRRQTRQRKRHTVNLNDNRQNEDSSL